MSWRRTSACPHCQVASHALQRDHPAAPEGTASPPYLLRGREHRPPPTVHQTFSSHDFRGNGVPGEHADLSSVCAGEGVFASAPLASSVKKTRSGARVLCPSLAGIPICRVVTLFARPAFYFFERHGR
ncbi:unnamed protein product [Scytosiphon promiscuus]